MAGDWVWVVAVRESNEIVGIWAEYGDIPNRYVERFDRTYFVWQVKVS